VTPRHASPERQPAPWPVQALGLLAASVVGTATALIGALSIGMVMSP
jgi:hypothetical protein